jgi:diguanylate cyclase (GGDEF)-like protein/PAS domain S-box-containing protein
MFAAIGRYWYWHTNEYFKLSLEADMERFYSVYTVQSGVFARHSRALAYSIAANDEIQRFLDEGNIAVHAEGGHDGGQNAARVRRELMDYMRQQWIDLRAQHELQHLHFILADGVSFLRMEMPSIFGDSLLKIRPMLADIARDQHPLSGLEVGHVYAGMVGMAAVVRPMPEDDLRYVGVVEIGFDMSGLLKRLDRQLDIGVAMLIDSDRVEGTMWERYQPALEARQSFLLAANRSEASEWLKAGLLSPGTRAPQSRLMEWQGRHFQLISFALDDYQGQLNEGKGKPAGTVLLWHDVSARVAQLQAEHITDIRHALIAYAVTQLGLLLLLRFSRREWDRRLKQSTATIESLSQRNTLLLDAAADGICGVDREGNITFINRTALAMHGFKLEEVLGRNPHELFHHHGPDGRAYQVQDCMFMQTLEDGEPREGEEWLIRRDGSSFPVKLTITPIYEQGQKNGAVVVFHDITEQRNRQDALLQLATTDSLTGASNRRHFLDQLDAELARQRRHGGLASLLMSDLDLFKRVNDDFGHAAGDAVLGHFVHIVRQTVRRSDVIGRMGGEEFAILLPGDGINGARELAERLRRAFESNPVKIGNVVIPATVSIGISELRADDMSADAPLHRADEALYSAKEAGRNRIALYDPTWTRSKLPRAAQTG